MENHVSIILPLLSINYISCQKMGRENKTEINSQLTKIILGSQGHEDLLLSLGGRSTHKNSFEIIFVISEL